MAYLPYPHWSITYHPIPNPDWQSCTAEARENDVQEAAGVGAGNSSSMRRTAMYVQLPARDVSIYNILYS